MKRPTFPSSLFSTDADSATLDAAWKGIGARRIRARRVRRTVLAAPLVAAIALVVFFVLRGAAPLPVRTIASHAIALEGGGALPAGWSAASPTVVALDDGSRLELAPNARLHPMGEQRDPTRVALVLESGTATFDVRPGGPRAWTIEAGDARVRVLGTRFTVAREGEHVRVSVERGKVRVESSRLQGGTRDLVAGEAVEIGTGPATEHASLPEAAAIAGLSALDPSAPARTFPPSATAAETIAPPPGSPARLSVPSSKRAQPEPRNAVKTGPADRMAEADAARMAGQPREALAILTSVVDDADPNAALAAFTIGKIHSEELGDRAAGAAWFERAIRLGLPVGLDEDAHARVVDCHGRAGNIDEAVRAASRYEAKYPQGRHLARVKRWKKE